MILFWVFSSSSTIYCNFSTPFSCESIVLLVNSQAGWNSFYDRLRKIPSPNNKTCLFLPSTSNFSCRLSHSPYEHLLNFLLFRCMCNLSRRKHSSKWSPHWLQNFDEEYLLRAPFHIKLYRNTCIFSPIKKVLVIFVRL